MQKKLHSDSNLGHFYSVLNTNRRHLEHKPHQELIKKSLRGDPRAQHRLFHLYVKGMYNVVFRMVADAIKAEDIVQEGFIKAFRQLGQYRGDAHFGAWLKRIMINTALNSIKKETPLFSELEVLDEEKLADDSWRHWEEELPNMERINREITNLPYGCRTVFTLYLIEGYEQQEVAQMLNISLSTVKTQYRRARLLLRDRLTKHGV